MIGAAWLDYGLGDPWSWPHPVQGMGWMIQRYVKLCLGCSLPPPGLRLAGIGLGLLLVAGSGAMAAIVVAGAHHWGGPLVGYGVETVLLASCFAGRSLRDAAQAVLHPLSSDDLAAARQQLSRYVGRDTQQLPPAEIFRAVLETVSENATDGVLAPLFYALLGALLGLGSVPLAMAYKAASTLDSMVGYRQPPYTDLGWFSARLEDGLTWLPCRLTVGTIALLSRRPRQVWRVCRRDAIADPSPNSGWSECAYAAALGVQLGGVNTYQGQPRVKPKLGDAERSIDAGVIQQALQFTRYSFLAWLGLGLLGLGLAGC